MYYLCMCGWPAGRSLPTSGLDADLSASVESA